MNVPPQRPARDAAPHAAPRSTGAKAAGKLAGRNAGQADTGAGEVLQGPAILKPQNRFDSDGRARGAQASGGDTYLKNVRLSDLISAMRNHMRLVLILTAVGTCTGFILAKRIVPRYAAEAVLLSDAALSGIVDEGSAREIAVSDPTATTTVVESISTEAVLDRALALLTPATIAQLSEIAQIEDLLAKATSPEETQAIRTAKLRDVLWPDLKVENSGRSYLVRVGFRSADPMIAAEVPNAVARAYLAYRIEMKRGAAQSVLDSISQDLAGLGERLAAAESRSQRMREQLRLQSARNESLTGRQQTEALAGASRLFADQREAEREAEATGSLYDKLLMQQQELQRQLAAPEVNVQLFSPASVPLDPSGMNVKPILLVLGLLGGFLAGVTIATRRETRKKEGESQNGSIG